MKCNKFKESKTLLLDQSEIRNPHKVTISFFSRIPIEDCTGYVVGMLKAANENDYWKKGQPGDLLYFHKNLERLIEAAFVMNNSSTSKKADKKRCTTDELREIEVGPYLFREFKQSFIVWESLPHSLSKKEFNNPFLVFRNFFKFHTLKEWRNKLYSLLFYSLISDSTVRAGVNLDYLGIYRHLQRLIEACYLIYVRSINK